MRVPDLRHLIVVVPGFGGSVLRDADGTPRWGPAFADIAKFESVLAEFLAGRVDEDAFRVFRLNNGIYGQRQGGRDVYGFCPRLAPPPCFHGRFPSPARRR